MSNLSIIVKSLQVIWHGATSGAREFRKTQQADRQQKSFGRHNDKV